MKITPVQTPPSSILLPIIAIMVSPLVLAKGKSWPVKIGALLVYVPWVALWALPGMLTIFFAIGRDMWREMR